MRKTEIDPSESIQTSGRPRSEAVETFMTIEPDTHECILFDDYDVCRQAYGTISSWCRRKETGHRPTIKRVESGWAIWKKTKG